MSYFLRAVCASCGHRVRVSVEHAGRRAKCPRCATIITFPESSQAYVVRTDTELTREAQAKAGAAEEVITTSQLLPEVPQARIAGRGTTLRVRPVVHPRKRQTALVIATLVGAVAILIGMAALIFRQPDRPASEPPDPPPAAPPKAPPPPPPPPTPFAKERAEVAERFMKFIKAYNSNDVEKLAGFYAVDAKEVRRAFGDIYYQSELKYELKSAPEIEVQDATTARVKFQFDRIKTTGTVKEELKDQEKTLMWIRKGEAWVISDAPGP